MRRLALLIGFLSGVLIVVVLNWYSIATMYEPYTICFDCGRTAGFPFTMYNSGYLWGGEGFIASGVFANICVAIISGGVLGCITNGVWQFISRRLWENQLK